MKEFLMVCVDMKEIFFGSRSALTISRNNLSVFSLQSKKEYD